MTYKTYSPSAKDISRNWHLIDLKSQVLGRTASQVASLLQGKHKPYYTPHLDCGDYVIAINAREVKLTGKKPVQKIYFHHTGYPGGDRFVPFAQMMAKDPRKVVELAVAGMLPKNKLRQPRLRRLKVFADSDHPYQDKFKNKFN